MTTVSGRSEFEQTAQITQLSAQAGKKERERERENVPDN
jgi:hypothetical protein